MLSLFCFLVVVAMSPLATTGLSQSVSPTPTIAVLGATGKLGSETMRSLIDRKVPVRCLVRPSSVEKIPQDILSSPLVEIVEGDLLAENSSDDNDAVFSDETTTASPSLESCLQGCSGVVACFGATRRTKFQDIFVNPEDIDPIHAKQINYRSMIALVKACKKVNEQSENATIRHIVRVTGKGEDPNGIFSVLLNGLGSYCKAWNYQGEVVLRTMLGNDNDDGIGYTIVRPGVMADASSEKDDDSDALTEPDNLLLADNGGNDLPVTKVGYTQIAGLLTQLALGAVAEAETSVPSLVTLAAMNPKTESGTASNSSPKSLVDKIAALQNDSRKFPETLVAEHKAAVKAFFGKVAAFGSVVVIAVLAVVSKVLFS
mmetsp:Transcript_30312/g.65029  ORF Transcript_30312/g.65029 Transcript_30312/m.65029 type:complete len:373 (+) Transcript_30312:86-1204(+)